jgi:hypothetical protein
VGTRALKRSDCEASSKGVAGTFFDVEGSGGTSEVEGAGRGVVLVG